jgi:hypothetical protein
MLPRAYSAIPLAQVAWHGFYLSMGNVHETEGRWWGVGEFVLWVIFYFWAVWTFNALLPPKPEQTPFEAYLGQQVGQQTEGGASAEREQQLDDGTADQEHHNPQHRH